MQELTFRISEQTIRKLRAAAALLGDDGATQVEVMLNNCIDSLVTDLVVELATGQPATSQPATSQSTIGQSATGQHIVGQHIVGQHIVGQHIAEATTPQYSLASDESWDSVPTADVPGTLGGPVGEPEEFLAQAVSNCDYDLPPEATTRNRKWPGTVSSTPANLG